MANLKEKFQEILEMNISYENCQGLVEDLFNNAKDSNEIKDFKIITDEDVYDSPGMDIYYISVAWIDNNNNLEIIGQPYYAY